MMSLDRSMALTLVLTACAQQATPDLGVALKGIDKSRFLACSGPPSLEYAEGGRDRMAFVTNLRRGAPVGTLGQEALAPASCSVNATFENSRLIQASFSGDLTMCQFVFNPCLPK